MMVQNSAHKIQCGLVRYTKTVLLVHRATAVASRTYRPQACTLPSAPPVISRWLCWS
jgi:hypothetical protein